MSEDSIEHRTVRHVPAGAPIDVPSGAFSSPFAMAREYAGDHFDVDAPVPPRPPAPTPAPLPVSTPTNEEQPMDKRTGPRGPHLMTRARETLKACGALTVEQLAEGLGVDQVKAQKLAANGIQAGHWTRQTIEGEKKLVLNGPRAAALAKAGSSGLKRYLKKRGEKTPPKAGKAPRKAARAKPVPAPRGRRPKAPVASLPPLPPAPIAPPADAPEDLGQYGLFNTGELRLLYAGQEMKLPRKATRALVDYLDKLASTLEE